MGVVYRPFGLLSDDELNYVLPLFIAEVVKKDGSLFPAATLRNLILSLQKFLEVTHGRIVKFLSDVKFKPIYDALDAVMRRSANHGVGLNSRQATVITEDMENILWRKSLLGESDGPTLLHTMVYLLGLHFAVRGRDEHRRLRHEPSQISVKVDNSGRRFLEYREVSIFISVCLLVKHGVWYIIKLSMHFAFNYINEPNCSDQNSILCYTVST